nr:hypothetical protein [Nitrospirota bacterium]
MRAIGWSLVVLLVAGCAGSPPPQPAEPVEVAPAHPEQHIQFVQTTGTSHWPKQPVKGTVWVKGPKGPGSDEAIIVARGALLMKGFDVVERDKLGALLKEQETQLKYGDDQSQVSVGKLVGAQLVAFVETASAEGKGYYADGFDVSVSVRVVGVETGEVFALGKARWTQPVASPTYGIDQLATQAVLRAFCPTDLWEDASPQNGWSGRCRQ